MAIGKSGLGISHSFIPPESAKIDSSFGKRVLSALSNAWKAITSFASSLLSCLSAPGVSPLKGKIEVLVDMRNQLAPDVVPGDYTLKQGLGKDAAKIRHGLIRAGHVPGTKITVNIGKGGMCHGGTAAILAIYHKSRRSLIETCTGLFTPKGEVKLEAALVQGLFNRTIDLSINPTIGRKRTEQQAIKDAYFGLGLDAKPLKGGIAAINPSEDGTYAIGIRGNPGHEIAVVIHGKDQYIVDLNEGLIKINQDKDFHEVLKSKIEQYGSPDNTGYYKITPKTRG